MCDVTYWVMSSKRRMRLKVVGKNVTSIRLGFTVLGLIVKVSFILRLFWEPDGYHRRNHSTEVGDHHGEHGARAYDGSLRAWPSVGSRLKALVRGQNPLKLKTFRHSQMKFLLEILSTF
jgi:hypothetical protein